MHMTGRLDARSELVMCTNRRTGAVYTTRRKRTQTVEPTDKQREAMKDANVNYTYQSIYELARGCLNRLLGESAKETGGQS